MTLPELRSIKQLLMDLRFMQAASIVALQMNENKQAIDYMKRISAAEKSVERDISLKETT